jgi:hypothetical protein
MSPFWRITLRLIYWLITRLQPLLRPLAERGFGNVVELIVAGRRTGRPRVVLLGFLQVDGRWYLGHPNGSVDWTRNLDIARRATLVFPLQPPVEIGSELLPIGEERERVIAVTWHQHVFPGNILYWLPENTSFRSVAITESTWWGSVATAGTSQAARRTACDRRHITVMAGDLAHSL